MRPHQLLVRVEEHPHHLVALGDPERVGRGLDPGSEVVPGRPLVILVPDQDADVASGRDAVALVLLQNGRHAITVASRDYGCVTRSRYIKGP